MLRYTTTKSKLRNAAVEAANMTEIKMEDSFSGQEVQKMIASTLQAFYDQVEESVIVVTESTAADALGKCCTQRRAVQKLELIS